MQRWGSMLITCGGMFTLGLVLAALGPALPELAARAGSSPAALGSLFSAFFLGALGAQVVAGPLSDRLGQRPLLLAGLLLLATGAAGLVQSRSLALTLCCAVVGGLGHGITDVSAHILIAEVFAERRAAALNLLNVFFGLGAFAGPALASLTLRWWSTALPPLWLGGGSSLLLLPGLWLLVEGRHAQSAAPHAAQGRSILRSPILWTLGLLQLLYVGIENGVGGWSTLYLEQSAGLVSARAALVTSGFWLAITGGRIAGALLGTRLTPGRLLGISLLGAVAGGALLLLGSGHAELSIAGTLLLGFSFGPIFPTTVALATSLFRHATGTAAGTVVALGSLGGMLLPWVQGLVLAQQGPYLSVLLVAAGTLGMLTLFGGYRLQTRRQV